MICQKSKVGIVTTTRAEFGLLNSFIKKLSNDNFFDVTLIVSGTHLVQEFGYTISEIKQSNLNCKIVEIPIIDNIADKSNIILANVLKNFGNFFQLNNFDCVVVLGDRFEILGVTECCLLLNIPIVHISGGDVTFGAIDDACRHSITKMANLHFTGNEDMRKRVIQMGENPEFVFNVGETGVENILKTNLMTFDEVKSSINFAKLEKQNYIVVTYHPETLSNVSAINQIKVVMNFILKHKEYCYIITKANIDDGGKDINLYIQENIKGQDNIIFVDSLGFVRYLSSLKYCKLVLGNSSSGIIEAPYFNIPTINIGNRQEGRMQAFSIVNAELNEDSLDEALKKCCDPKFVKYLKDKNEYLYGDGNSSEKMVKILKDFITNKKLNRKKIFYDIK